MPPVGGFVALCANSYGKESCVQKTPLHGDFFKIEFLPPFYVLKGKLNINFNTYRISHGGIKVRLEGYLQINRTFGRTTTFKSIDIIEHYPTEVLLACDDLLRGQKKLNFSINIPHDRRYPTTFLTSYGSLTYRLVALINRDDNWEIIARKLLNFKGFHKISGSELCPLTDTKLLQSGKITSIFTAANVMVVMGRNECLKATLKVQGGFENETDATLSFLRNINYGGNIHTDIIWSNTQRKDQKEDILFEWSFGVPVMSRASYSNELIPLYSVRYFLKYEVKFVGVDNCEDIKGYVEVIVGTERNSSGSDIAHGSNEAAGQRAQMNRRRSVVSLLSMLSLPPAYSQLTSRSGSVSSIETLPPRYDEL